MLSKDVVEFEIEAPIIASKVLAGQFVVIKVSESGERIPLTVAEKNTEKGTITIVVLGVGKTTAVLAEMEEGDEIMDLVGPLGRPSEIEDFGEVVIIGGGVGIAPIYPIAKSLKASGNYVVTIIGAKNKDGLIFIDELTGISDEFHICTDDGSNGYKGFVSCFLDDYLKADRDKKVKRVIAIGPVLMMKAVCDLTKTFRIKTIVSLNPIMVDGTGMCGSCRVEIAGETKFGCVDGPEFDGHQVNFDLLIQRLGTYIDEEKEAMTLWEKKNNK